MSRRAWVAFVAVSILWGTPYLFIKVAVQEVSPSFLAWSRVLIATIVLLPLTWRLGAFAGLRGRHRAVIAYAALEIALPFTLIPIGELFVSSSLTAILISCMALGVALLSLRFAPHERLTPARVAGLVIGLAGVASRGCSPLSHQCPACEPQPDPGDEDRSEPIRGWVSEDRRRPAGRWGAWTAKIRLLLDRRSNPAGPSLAVLPWAAGP